MPEPSYTVDFAAACDDEADLLAEKFGCSRAIALRFLEWHHAQFKSRENPAAAVNEAINQILPLLIKTARNMRAWNWGLIFAAGLDASNGVRSMAEVARAIGVKRALISHYEREWKLALPFLTDLKFCRTESAVENSRQARLRQIAGRKNGATTPHAQLNHHA